MINWQRGLCSVGSGGNSGLHGLRYLIVSCFNTIDLIIKEQDHQTIFWTNESQWSFSRATKALRQWEKEATWDGRSELIKNLNIFQYFEIKIFIHSSRKCWEETEIHCGENRQSDFAQIPYAKYRQRQNEPPSYEESTTIFKCPLGTAVELAIQYATFVWDLSQVWQCLINDQILRFSTFRRSANFKSECDANPPPEIFKIESMGIDGIVWRIWDIWHSRGQKRLNVSWGPLLRWSNTMVRVCQKTEWHGFRSKYRTWGGTWCPRHSI